MHFSNMLYFILYLFAMFQAMLLKMPGITSKNVYAIMDQVTDLAELVTLSQERLAEILGSNPHARLLHNFLHRKQTDTDNLPENRKSAYAGRKQPLLKGVKRKR